MQTPDLMQGTGIGEEDSAEEPVSAMQRTGIGQIILCIMLLQR
jgi:hypothetical protein